MQKFYVFTAADSTTGITSCEMYRFQVTARSSGGDAGPPSEAITKSLPSVPVIAPVEHSLVHSLMLSGDGVQLTVSFHVSLAK